MPTRAVYNGVDLRLTLQVVFSGWVGLRGGCIEGKYDADGPFRIAEVFGDGSDVSDG